MVRSPTYPPAVTFSLEAGKLACAFTSNGKTRSVKCFCSVSGLSSPISRNTRYCWNTTYDRSGSHASWTITWSTTSPLMVAQLKRWKQKHLAQWYWNQFQIQLIHLFKCEGLFQIDIETKTRLEFIQSLAKHPNHQQWRLRHHPWHSSKHTHQFKYFGQGECEYQALYNMLWR